MLYDALIPSLEEVGARFERGDYFVPEMLIAARAMQGALDILRPLLAETGAKPIGTYVMGTVKGDVHDIGKNLVNIMLEGAGFTVYDLGVNVAPEIFVAKIQEHKPDVVGFSAFLTTTMPMFKANINALEKAGHPRRRDRDGRRRARHAGVRDRGRRRRLRGRRLDRRPARQGPDRAKTLRGHRVTHEAARARRGSGEEARVRLPDVRPVRAALDRPDVPDELPEDAPQRAVRRRAARRRLRGEARDALRLGEGRRALARSCRGREEIHDLRQPVDNRLKDTSSWAELLHEARQAGAEGLACRGLRTRSRRGASSSPPSC